MYCTTRWNNTQTHCTCYSTFCFHSTVQSSGSSRKICLCDCGVDYNYTLDCIILITWRSIADYIISLHKNNRMSRYFVISYRMLDCTTLHSSSSGASSYYCRICYNRCGLHCVASRIYFAIICGRRKYSMF